jgi:hypothetical protein
MNSAPQIRTVEISDAELDNVSGGLSQAGAGTGVTVGASATADAGVVGQLDPVAGQVLGSVTQQLGASVSL